MNRVKIDIDRHSYLCKFNDPNIRSIIIFVHGIFGKYNESWDKTPSALMEATLLSKVDFGSFGYNTSVIDFEDARPIVGQLILWMKTHLGQYDDIFIVAHSMGGLIVREACADLLSSSSPDHELFQKIRHNFFIAVPLSGAYLARVLDKIPIVRGINKKIKFLAHPNTNSYSRIGYRAVVATAKEFKLKRAKFSIFWGTSDNFVSAASPGTFTEDDIEEGPIPGTHSSVKDDVDPNSTLIKRILQVLSGYLVVDSRTRQILRKAELQSTPRTQPTNSTAAAKGITSTQRGERNIVLISCSATKNTHGHIRHPGTAAVIEQVADPEIGLESIEMRAKTMGLIQQGRLDGIEFREGNRGARRQNMDLVLGPDFGGVVNEVKYLPAYLRYAGRCYQATPEEWESFNRLAADQRPGILIMSGLYGLFPYGEHIQNYDCHITDLDSREGLAVNDYWGRLMTDILISHMEYWEGQGYRIRAVIDLLSEKSYQACIDWQRIYPRWQVLHRIFEKNADRDALANLGIWFRKVIREPGLLGDIEPDQFYQDPDFRDNDRIAFETRLGESSLPVAR